MERSIEIPLTCALLWGDNQYGQLGLGYANIDIVHEPRPIQNVANTSWTHIECGDLFTVALSSNGELYTWGLNWFYQLGHGDRKDRTVPTKVERFSGEERVVTFACGVRHVAVVTTTGKLFTWYVLL